ncbi:MAG: homocysteine S-methyltransferase family protein [Fimbriimonadaceae bacterium]|nr:homocysteine S-methyltransferase family protein [Fimbriimonadaceae bacterium]
MGSTFLERLGKQVLVFDGAMGTQLQAAGLETTDFCLPSGSHDDKVAAAARRLEGKPLEGCNEVLNFTRPDVVAGVHRAYFEAGADIVETNTFGSTAVVLAEYEVPELVYEITLPAAQIARKVADEFSTPERPRFVCGAVGPGTRLVSLGQATFDEVRQSYFDAYRALIDGGSDLLLIETMQDLLVVKAALVGATDAMEATGKRLPLLVQVTMEQTGTMLLGSEMGAALNMLEAFPQVVGVGLNCATGPVEMATHVRFLSQNSTRPISVLPNAGLPVMEKGHAVYKLTPDELADHHERFVDELGVAMVGGCCGTTPAHIEAVSSRLSGKGHTEKGHWQAVRDVFPGFDFEVRRPEQAEAFKLVGCSSLYQFQPYKQDSSFLIIGEKTNANGSKAFREMLAAENWEGLTELARDLEAEGSHVLDVCTAYVGRKESRDMATLLSHYNRHIQVPLMVDSTEVDVVEVALQGVAGKPIVNSINFEDGERRTEAVLRLCRRYGAAVVGLTIDEDGMAKTVERKVEVTKRLVDHVRAAGLCDHDLFVDCLTFTLGSGDEEFREAGVATIEAIREVKRLFPRVNTTLGVSNISFGLKPAARVVLNSAFLHYALEAGLTSAIVHFSKILPDSRIGGDVWKIATDLVFDRREYALA